MNPRDIRRIILEQSKRAHVGHIGSALSVADIIAVLYGGVLRLPSLDALDRDRFILSKGHAALALYAALYLRGDLSQAQLDTFCADDSQLGVHPEHCLHGVDFSTGSLGQGLSVGAGAALAARLAGSARRVYVLLSDAECNEGSVWEAAMFAAHHQLANLTAILDLNGQQAFGYTRDVLNIPNMAERWRVFGWDVIEVDGHNSAALTKALQREDTAKGAPRMVLAHTTFGKGVSYMQNQIKWHYFPMSEAEYQQAMREQENEGEQ
jgi:transketolase